jgi:hypothetical protein
MKKIILQNFDKIDQREDINTGNKVLIASGQDEMDASDGYHTFTELYDHRIALYIALCKVWVGINSVFKDRDEEYAKRYPQVWRSKLHSDGTSFDGWFVLGINKEKGRQITYHLPLSKWNETEFAETLENAPEFDQHSSADVIDRIKSM